MSGFTPPLHFAKDFIDNLSFNFKLSHLEK